MLVNEEVLMHVNQLEDLMGVELNTNKEKILANIDIMMSH